MQLCGRIFKKLPPTPFCPHPAPKSLYKGEPLLNREDLRKIFVWFEEMLTWRKERLRDLRRGCMTPGCLAMLYPRTLGKVDKSKAMLIFFHKKVPLPLPLQPGGCSKRRPGSKIKDSPLEKKFFFCILRIGANFSFLILYFISLSFLLHSGQLHSEGQLLWYKWAIINIEKDQFR